MRRGRLVAAFAVAAAVLAGCGGAAGGGGSAPTEVGGAFPRTITHGQGTAVIPAAPQRVVVLGMADTQIAAALGTTIVGATTNPSSADGAWPGVSPQIPAEIRTLDSITPNLEALASLRPDLILMTSAQSGFYAAYPRISAIAPTISYQKGMLLDSGADVTRIIGKALGKDAEADALVTRSVEQLTQYKAEHPAVEGTTYTFGQYAAGTTYLVIAQDGPTAQLFDAIGVRQPAGIASLPIWQAGMAQVAPENLGVLDEADVAFIGATDGGAAFAAQPLVADLDLTRAGRLNFLTADEASLLLQPNPATTGAVLELVAPKLEKART